MSSALAAMRFIDIGANLTDTMYKGEYNGTARYCWHTELRIGRIGTFCTNTYPEKKRAKYRDIIPQQFIHQFWPVTQDSSRHTANLSAVLSRAREAGVERLLVTGGSLAESRAALQLAREHPRCIKRV